MRLLRFARNDRVGVIPRPMPRTSLGAIHYNYVELNCDGIIADNGKGSDAL
jgi:hypothetical protein